MRVRPLLIAVSTMLFPVLAGIETPAAAQDLNTLSRHLEHQQATRVQDHQNRMRQGDTVRRAPQQDRNCSADALPAADRRALETEYESRFRSDGKASADAWIREEGRLFRERLVAEGVCPP